MGTRFDSIKDHHKRFIAAQKMFFVATAGDSGRVNLSPKGMDSFKVLGPNRVIWLNVTGSGNETAAHILEQNRMTIMFCAFEGKPVILRLYGSTSIYHPGDEAWDEHIALFPPLPAARQLFDVQLDLVQTSCGMAVPFYDFKAQREDLNKWAEKKNPDEIHAYWRKKNTKSIDGKLTDLSK